MAFRCALCSVGHAGDDTTRAKHGPATDDDVPLSGNKGNCSANREWAQLVHIATDGETYGHHHRGGEQALAYALDAIESSTVARLTNYGEFIDLQPPTHEVEILENTSWSCVHGVDRWRRDCGCNGGSGQG